MSEWKESTLDEEYEFTSGLSKSRDQFGFGHGFVSFKDVFYNYFLPSELGELANTTEKEQKSCSVKRGDVFLTRTSETFNELGMSSVALKDYDRATFNGFTKRLRPKQNSKIWPEYIGYYFRSSFFRSLVTSMATMTTRASLNNEILSKLKVRYPPLPEQKAIAHILGTLDEKIELNRKMNQTLEAMAQALFKSWFVDFDPVIDNLLARQAGALAQGNDIPEELQARAEKRRRLLDGHVIAPARRGGNPDEEGMKQSLKPLLHTNPSLAAQFPDSFVFNETLGKWIPEGWGVEKLGKKVEIKRGGSPRPIQDFMVENGYPWLKISDATAENSPFIFNTKEFIKEEGLKKTVYLNEGELILSNSATPGLPKFLTIKACIHDGWLYFPKKEVFTDEYLYFLFLVLRESFVNKGNGSVFTNLKTDIIKNEEVVLPSIQIINQFTKITKSYLSRLKESRLEIETLTQLRERLLPELISGRVRVKEGIL